MAERRTRRRTGCLFVVALAAVLLYVALPYLATRVVRFVVARAGLGDVALRVRSVTPWRLVMTGVEAPGVVGIERLVLDFSPEDLWSGRVRAIRCYGVRARVPLAGGEGGASRPSVPPTFVLPVDRVEIADALVTFFRPGFSLPVPLALSLSRPPGAAPCAVVLEAQPAGGELRFVGTWEESTGAVAGRLDLTAPSASAFVAALGLPPGDLPARPGAGFSGRAEGAWSPTSVALTAAVTAGDVSVVAGGVTARFCAVAVRGRWEESASRPATSAAALTLSEGEVLAPSAGLALRGVEALVPLGLGTGAPGLDGVLSVRSIELSGEPLTPLTAALGVGLDAWPGQGLRRVRVAARASLAAGATLAASGAAELLEGAARVEAALALPDVARLLREVPALSSRFRGRASGRLEARATLSVAPGAPLTFAATLCPGGLDVAADEPRFALRGVTGSVPIGARSAARGPLAFASLEVGARKFPAFDGRAAAAVEGATVALDVAGTWAAAAVAAHGTWSAGETGATLDVEAPQVERLLAAVPSLGAFVPGRVRGAATLSVTLGSRGARRTASYDLDGRTVVVDRLAARPDLTATLSHVALRGTLAWAAGAPATGPATVSAEGGTLALAAAGLTLRGLRGSVPLAFGPGGALAAGGPGQVYLEALETSALRLPPVEVEVTVQGPRLRFQALCPVLAGGTLRARGRLERGPRGIEGRAELALPRFKLADPASVARLLPPMAGWQVEGELGLSGSVELGAGGLVPDLALELADVSLGSVAWDCAIDGVRGAVAVTRFWPPRVPGRQQVVVRSAHLGALRVAEGAVAFESAPGDALRVVSLSCGFAGGRLVCRDALVDLAQAGTWLTVGVAGVDLAALLDLVAPGRVTGGGRLSGELRVRPVWSPAADLQFGAGLLATSPPPGFFRIAQAEDARTVLGLSSGNQPKSGAKVDPQAQIMERVQKALEDFEFDELEVRLAERSKGELMTYVRTKGRGPRGPGALAIGGLNLNVAGLDRYLKEVLLRTSDAKLVLEHNVDRAMDQFFGPADAPAAAPASQPADDPDAVNKALSEFF